MSLLHSPDLYRGSEVARKSLRLLSWERRIYVVHPLRCEHAHAEAWTRVENIFPFGPKQAVRLSRNTV
jgi:hypothetical protein